jgi:protein-disulfide isomerase
MPKGILLAIMSVLSITVLTVFILVVLPDKAFEDKAELEDVPEILSEPRITFIDPIFGSEDANITIVEYGDYLCPLCQTIAPELKALIEEAPRKRRLIWKDAPNIEVHDSAITIAMAARCAQNQGEFWTYNNKILESHGSISTAEQLKNLALQIGLDESRFTSCMISEVTRPVVLHTLQEAIAVGATGTPTLFINGKLYTGAITKDAINAYIESL